MIIQGNEISKKIQNDIKKQIDYYVAQQNRFPCLSVIIVGDNQASQIYVERKRKVCEEIGIRVIKIDFNKQIPSKEQLVSKIDELNNDDDIDGILVQLPLPPVFNPQEIIYHINPDKDVDGLHPYNIGMLAIRNPTIHCCTPYGIMKIFEYYNIDVKGMDCVIIGASNIVGRPMCLELLLAGSTVTLCHRFTKDLGKHTMNADIIISAVGKQEILLPEMVKEGCIVIDVGINRDPVTGKICGDVGKFEEMVIKTKYITPVPGGVGPMTVAMLSSNLFSIYKKGLLNGRR